VVNISNPSAPAIVGTADTPGEAYGVAVAGNHAYVADFEAGLTVVDITSPTSPAILGTVITPDYSLAVSVSGTRAYIADNDYGLVLLPIQCGAEIGIADPPPTASSPPPLRIHPSVPNPFHHATEIRFELAEPGPVSLEIYDVSGRRVRALAESTGLSAGRQTMRWDGRDDRGHRLASGIYLCRITAGRAAQTQRLVLIH
jgi:hypothetical protein